MILKGGHCRQCGYCCTHRLYGTDERHKEYDEYQGCIVKSWKGKTLIASLPVTCDKLEYRNQKYYCKLHGKHNQPVMCKTWPEDREPFFEGLNIFNECGYFFFKIDVDTPDVSAC
jgi:hypothetical protein